MSRIACSLSLLGRGKYIYGKYSNPPRWLFSSKTMIKNERATSPVRPSPAAAAPAEGYDPEAARRGRRDLGGPAQQRGERHGRPAFLRRRLLLLLHLELRQLGRVELEVLDRLLAHADLVLAE